MPEVLNLDVLNPSTREINLTIPGGSNLLNKILRRPETKTVKIILHTPSFRLQQELTQRYSKFVSLSLAYAKDPLNNITAAEEMHNAIIDFIVIALKPDFPPISREWLGKNSFTDEALAEIFNFLIQPIQEKIRKNAEALQSLLAVTK